MSYDPTPEELVTDVRQRLADHPHGWLPSDVTTMRRLCDALESTTARLREAETMIADSGTDQERARRRYLKDKLAATEERLREAEATIDAAIHEAPGLGELHWRKVDKMIGILTRHQDKRENRSES